MTNHIIRSKLKDITRSSHAVIFETPKGYFEIMYSFGDMVGVYDGTMCLHLPFVRKTTKQHVLSWVGDRGVGERSMEDLQSVLATFFS